MTVQTPGSGAPQVGGSPAPQAGGAGSPSDPPQDGTQGNPQAPGSAPQDDVELTPELRQQLDGWLRANEQELPAPIREMLKDYRQEARSLRQKLKEQGSGQPQGAPGAQPGQAAGAISPEEYQRREQQWETRLRQQGVRSEVAMASAKLGIVDPEAAYRLLDTDDLDFDDKGNPTNVEAALRSLTRERPWLVNRAPRGGADGGAGGQAPRQGASMNDVLRQATGRGPRGG